MQQVKEYYQVNCYEDFIEPLVDENYGCKVMWTILIVNPVMCNVCGNSYGKNVLTNMESAQ